jgi:hypothetical protein
VYLEAIKFYEQGLKIQPENADVEPARAVQAWEELLKRTPKLSAEAADRRIHCQGKAAR